jgi:hypothetical protein
VWFAFTDVDASSHDFEPALSWLPSLALGAPSFRGTIRAASMIALNGSDALDRSLRFVITTLPQHGQLCLPVHVGAALVRDVRLQLLLRTAVINIFD